MQGCFRLRGAQRYRVPAVKLVHRHYVGQSLVEQNPHDRVSFFQILVIREREDEVWHAGIMEVLGSASPLLDNYANGAKREMR